ncbi:serine/threonine protein kinase [Actinomadura fibrosa]|uniref:Serine/threonine protein kinase n=1 Tax=Actinomadura fibrosa TaxID=111802 RepID=A0ABW2XIF6_9ACTN|nr:serine/threonine-protein kinase [Actinomadura fibrosa]
MPEALPLQPGDPRRLGAYEITGRLGVGEQGAVFLGTGPAARLVAVKLLHVRLSGEPVARSRFAGAFASARKVSGFCTAAILDADVEGDRPYVVSEWVDGPSLQQLVDEEGKRGAGVVERLAVGTAVALAAVHRAGALHHDLKPGNILLGRRGPRMSDFGIAHALEAVSAAPAGHITEDPAYKAPEQLSGKGIGPAVDVFAWAATMLFAASGKPPFGDDSPSEVMQRIVYDEPDLSSVPDSLGELLAHAFSKDPADRPTAKELLERLLDEKSPLADRMPTSMVEEGRALASGSGPLPQPQAPEPAAPEPVVPGSTPPRSPMGAAPFQIISPPLSVPPPQQGASPTRPSGPPAVAPPPVSPPAEPETPALDPAAFEKTAWFNAIPESDPASETRSDLRADDRYGTRYDAVAEARYDAGAEPTATFNAFSPASGSTTAFDAIDPAEPSDRTDTTLIPGMKPAHDGGSGGGRHGGPALASRIRIRRPSNHVLGVALSLTIGVAVGIAIIALVLWPQLKDDPGPPADQTNASDNRPVTTIPSAFAGTWKGTVVNTNRNASFPVEVTFQTGGTTARAVYPREKCTGTLTLSKGTESSLNMALSIPKPCTAGTVRITRQPDGTLQYAWSKPGTQLGYAGKLSRG